MVEINVCHSHVLLSILPSESGIARTWYSMGSCISKHPSATKQIQEQQPVAQPVAAGPVVHFTLVFPTGQHIEVSTPGSDPVSILPQLVIDGASDAEPLELSDLLSVSLADGALWQSGNPACPTLLTGVLTPPSLSGSWAVTGKSASGAYRYTMTLKESDGAVTGEVKTSGMSISGTMDHATGKFSFKQTTAGKVNSPVYTCTATLSGKRSLVLTGEFKSNVPHFGSAGTFTCNFQPSLATCGVMDQVSCPGCPCVSAAVDLDCRHN